MKTDDITKAIILVGGWGTRLRPLTYTIPKPLIPFCNKPILKYQIEKLVLAGVKTIVLAVNYMSELIIAECNKYEQEFDIEIIYSKEDTPLGTGGALALAKKYIGDESFFLLNSDICCSVDFNKMKENFIKSRLSGSILTYEVDDPTRYGLIKVSGDKIVSFKEKPKTKEGSGPWIINAGMYILSSDVFDYIDLREMSIEKEVFPILAKKGLLTHYPLEGHWMDIGQIKEYLEGQRMNLKSLVGKAVPEGWEENPYSQYKSPYLCYKTNVVIGNNVNLGSNVKLENCAIFDGVSIGNNTVIKNSIIGWDCVIGDNCNFEETTVLGKGVCIENNIVLRSMQIEPEEIVNSANIESLRLKVEVKY